MSGQYCIDANIFITSWNSSYPINVFQSLWNEVARYRNDIIIIKPIFDEIDPISSSDRKLPKNKKTNKYPLRVWMIDNQLESTSVSDEVQDVSLGLEIQYETNNNPKGANQNDIILIAYAKINGITVVTFEEDQPQRPGKKCNYKIPLICREQQVACINFVTMLKELNINI